VSHLASGDAGAELISMMVAVDSSEHLASSSNRHHR
jgi:hypothetical protein